MTAAALAPELNRREAYRLFAAALEEGTDQADCVEVDLDELDGVVWWTCAIVSEAGQVVGSAQFPEHWPEVLISWGCPACGCPDTARGEQCEACGRRRLQVRR